MLDPQRMRRLRTSARVSLLELSDGTGLSRFRLHRYENHGVPKLSDQEQALIEKALKDRLQEAVSAAIELAGTGALA